MAGIGAFLLIHSGAVWSLFSNAQLDYRLPTADSTYLPKKYRLNNTGQLLTQSTERLKPTLFLARFRPNLGYRFILKPI